MQRLLDVSQSTFYFRDDTNEVVNIESSASWAGHDCHSTRPQAKRLNNFPRHPNLILRFSCQRDANGVAYSFTKQYAQTNRRLHGSAKRSTSLRDSQVKWIIN